MKEGNSMNNEKYYKDGNVAVLYSPGFGAGWYSIKKVNLWSGK
jgi:hypothetical protein